jgi:hypothetical protein
MMKQISEEGEEITFTSSLKSVQKPEPEVLNVQGAQKSISSPCSLAGRYVNYRAVVPPGWESIPGLL